jgi:hypothetical protein
MDLFDLETLHNVISKKSKKTIHDKNNDYSHEEDALDNFKKQWIICEALGLDNSPKAQAMRLLILKIIRITNLWNKPDVNFESLIDSHIDLNNYSILAEACRQDENS